MDQILNANDVGLAQLVLDQLIAGDRDPLAVYLGETPLVNQLPDGFQIGVSPGNVGLANTEHVDRGLVQSDEHSVVDLEETEELEDLTYFGGYFVNTERKKRKMINQLKTPVVHHIMTVK